MAENPYKEDEMKKTTNKKKVINDSIDQVYYDGIKSTFDLNDYNTQETLPADGGLKDDLNDIKILLKSMNDNLDKILHHLNGGWN